MYLLYSFVSIPKEIPTVRKRIGQHKSISISLSIHILMSEKLSQTTWRVGEDELQRVGTTSSSLLPNLLSSSVARCLLHRARSAGPPVVSKGTHLDLDLDLDHYGWMDGRTGPIEVFDWMDELNRRLLEASWMWMVGTGGFKARLGGLEIQDLPASWHCASCAGGTNKERRKASGRRSKARRHRWLGCQHRRARSRAHARVDKRVRGFTTALTRASRRKTLGVEDR
jgi:hypothetical protein